GLLLTIGSLCNDAVLKHEAETGSYTALGDPTEGSLTIAAANFGLEKNRLDQLFPRIGEIPFDSDRKRMSTIHQQPERSRLKYNVEWMSDDGIDPDDRLVFTKGSVDGLLEVCNRIYHDRTVSPMTPEMVERINRSNLEFAQKGMRILATAYKPIRELPSDLTPDTIEQELIFVGMFAIIDPPREEVKPAVQTCRRAGIRPVMITGDHPLTALHIARQLGIADNDQVLTGKKLDQMPMEEFSRMVENVSVFARVSPEHKLKIIQALQAKGHIVSMTGDGVNDAPALKKADIGVAMGITGTDVSKEAADMVLRDDNFSTIVAAVEEGRVIFDNIRKFIQYSIAGNIGKILAVLILPFLGMPMPLLPLQLLWLNLLTDGLLGLGIGMEPAEANTMRRPPYPPNRPIFDAVMLRQVILMGLAIGLIAILAGYVSWVNRIENWQTILFTTLAVAQMFQALGVRSYRDSIFKIGLMSNRTMAGMIALAFILQLGAIYIPFLQTFFTTRGLTLPQLLLTIGIGSLILVLTEFQKLIRKP
ncbi:MAG: cation-translocating P-type ATPase, partial [Candidatus Delongbacteria bacterium]|nr:cation-translocating P-type ATPase [Candidatus Delongbacteria bacterium]